jgi:hypothetical protein
MPPPPDLSGGALVDAAWLAETTSFQHAFTRGERLDQIAFAQRMFGNVPPDALGDAFTAVRAFRQQRMLMLTVERMGISDPAIYASAARGAASFAIRDPDRAFWSLAQLQGALALVARMTSAGTLNRATAGMLLVSLCSVPLESDGRYAGAMAEWLEGHFLPLLPDGDDVEGRIIAAVAGPSNPGVPRVSWEGQRYRLDLAFAEARHLRVARAKQASYTVDLALALNRVLRTLDTDRVALQDAQTAAAALTALSVDFAATLTRPTPDVRAEGVRPPPSAAEGIRNAVAELTPLAGERDLRKVARITNQLSELVDTVLGEALLSLAYALDIGDPDGTALLARNVALRHDFGLTHRDAVVRARVSWSLPRQDARPGVPWRVTGSALGLDVALAPLSLRRLSADAIEGVPRLSPTERDAFSVAVALMDPRRLRDEDRDAIAAAVARGRQRVAGLADGEDFEAVADLVALDGWRRRAVRWMLQNDQTAVPSLFSLVDLLMIGGGAPGADLDAWGMTALVSASCPCTRLVPPSQWTLLAGRPQLGLMAATMADLNLHVALMLYELGVPAALAQPVLEAAVQEFIESVAPTDSNDWWTLARTAQAVPRERIEDYVATAAAVGGPLVPDEPGSGF